VSIKSQRNKITRLSKRIAKLEKKLSKKKKKEVKLKKDISKINKRISKSSNVSSMKSKQRKLERKDKKLTKLYKEMSKLKEKIASKNKKLSRAQNMLEKELDKRQKKREREEKKRMRNKLKKEKQITKELEEQAYLHSEMEKNRLVINLDELPTEIKVLFFAANPKDQSNLQLNEEIRAIESKIRASEYRDSVKLISKWAVRPDDLLQALNEHNPHIVHFSGHGSSTDEIIFLNEEGKSKPVEKKAIVQLMKTMSDNISVVIFNTCYSSNQAKEITDYIDVAIGMNTSIGDEAALVFAAQFYSAIGFGRSVKNAFDQAKTSLMIEGTDEENIPELFSKEGLNPEELILVRPDDLDEEGNHE